MGPDPSAERIAKIRERLSRALSFGPSVHVIDHAPDDMAWLLSELEAAQKREAEALKRVPAVKEHYCGTERVLVAATFSDEVEGRALLYTFSEGKPFNVPMADVRSYPDE
jgi:hypothetical protein